MTKFAVFGDPNKFAISMRWIADSEPRSRRPTRFGWSMGNLRITIAGSNITQSRRGASIQSHVSWYLLPFLDWLASNWTTLFHEEDFAWVEKSSAPALVACHRALEHWIGEEDDIGKNTYRAVQAWYRRHGLRAAAEGGLFPDFFIRRFFDDVELSWSPHSPLFAPKGFTYVMEPGTARFSVSDVAAPLWEALNWAVSTLVATESSDQNSILELEKKIASIRTTPLRDFAAAYVPSTIFAEMQSVFSRLGASDLLENEQISDIPAIAIFSPAVAMFGGVSPELGRSDVEAIGSLLVTRRNLGENVDLSALTLERAGRPLGVPHEDGYAFAAELLEDLGEPGASSYVDVRGILERVGIEVQTTHFTTNTIRGVALAGAGFGPTILLNMTSIYNESEDGRRFTLAHELCHILFDRTRARRVTIASGPWVAPGIEKRANAFAAYFLMPRMLVRPLLPASGRIERENVVAAARALHVNETALVEHIYNLDFISDMDRDRLRMAFRA